MFILDFYFFYKIDLEKMNKNEPLKWQIPIDNYAGCNVPAKTNHAKSDFDTRLKMI